MSHNPYEQYVTGEDLLRTLERTPRRIEQVVSAWPDDAVRAQPRARQVDRRGRC